MTTPCIALLRGINVGGRNRLTMAALTDMFREAGASDVRTYIQSGNVVFKAASRVERSLARTVTAALAEQFELNVPVQLWSGDAWRAAVRDNPFVASGAEPKSLHVGFLADKPTAARVAKLDPDRSPGDSFRVINRAVYLHLPNGAARSKFTNRFFDDGLNTISTARNWRTTLKLLAMLDEN